MGLQHGMFAQTCFVAIHQHAPVRQFLHRPHGQPAAPIEKRAIGKRQLVEDFRLIRADAAVQHQIVTASDDHERVELYVFARRHRRCGPGLTAPAPPRPQTLLAENEPTRRSRVYLDRISHHVETKA